MKIRLETWKFHGKPGNLTGNLEISREIWKWKFDGEPGNLTETWKIDGNLEI